MKHIVIGIGGGSGSGKTSIAQQFADELGPGGCLVLSQDRYYRDLPTHHGGAPAFNFDEPASLEVDLLVDHLRALRSGQAVDVPEYDFATCRRRGALRVEPTPVIVVEGILALSLPDVRPLYHHAVFVDAAEHVRLGRRMRRDAAERGRSADAVLEQYFTTVRPMHERWVQPARALADVVLDGTAPLDRSVSAVRALLRRP